MVVNLTNITQIKTAVLDSMDIYDYIAVGTGTATPLITDTALGTEVDRNITTSNIKNVALGTYLFATTFTVSEANGNTLSEYGVFDLASGGEMWSRNLITPNIVKTTDIEVVAYTQTNIKVTNT